MDDGTLHRFRAQRTILATGGYGRAYFSCTAASTCTGDGGGGPARGYPGTGHGCAVPTGVYGVGALIKRAPGRGRHPCNSEGERSWSATPSAKDLASRRGFRA